MKYPDKFCLTPEQSLFLAKKKMDENVYCGMKMENRVVTFPQTLLSGEFGDSFSGMVINEQA